MGKCSGWALKPGDVDPSPSPGEREREREMGNKSNRHYES